MSAAVDACGELVFRAAKPEEAALLTALALRSKAHWGYPPTFIDACRDELRVTATDIMAGSATYVVAERESRIIGFYGLTPASGGRYELEALFVDPAHIGTGIGRGLMQHALDNVAARGGGSLVVQGDPNAEGFYRAAGGVPAGASESGSMPGRFLPVFEISVARSS